MPPRATFLPLLESIAARRKPKSSLRLRGVLPSPRQGAPTKANCATFPWQSFRVRTFKKTWALVVRQECIGGWRTEAGQTRITSPTPRSGCSGKARRREGGRMKKNGERNDQRDRVKQFAGPRGITVQKRTQRGEMSDSPFHHSWSIPTPSPQRIRLGWARPVQSQRSPTHEYCFGDMSRCREPSPRRGLS